MIVNDNSSVVSEQSLQLIDYARGAIYDRRMFIIQATDVYYKNIMILNDDARVVIYDRNMFVIQATDMVTTAATFVRMFFVKSRLGHCYKFFYTFLL
jgi:hypothetical protein